MALVKRVAVPPAKADGGRAAVVVGLADDKFLVHEANMNFFNKRNQLIIHSFFTNLRWLMNVYLIDVPGRLYAWDVFMVLKCSPRRETGRID